MPSRFSINSKYLKGFALTLVALFYGSFLVYQITLPAAQDLPRQMKNGEMILHGQFDVLTKNVYSYTEPQHSFANHHWLYGVIAYLMFLAIGWNGLVIFKVLFLLATFALLFYLTVQRSDFWLALFFSVPTIFILIGRGAMRPEIFSYFFVVLFLYVLLDLDRNPKHNRIFWLIAVEVIWVNIHLFFGVGILLVGGFLFEKIVLNFKNLKNSLIVKKLSIVLIGLIGAIFINAYGLMGALFSLRVNADTNFPLGSAEINTLSNVLKDEPIWDNFSAAIFEPLVIVLALSFIIAFIYRLKYKKKWYADNFIFYFLASTGSAVLGFFVIRGLPFLGFIFLPAICANLNDIFIAGKAWLYRKGIRSNNVTIISAALILVAVFGGLIMLGQKKIMRPGDEGIGLASWSESSAHFFIDQKITGPIFNDTDIGSYLIYYLYPQEKVFADNRFGDAYSASFFRDIYLPMIQDDTKWTEGMNTYGFNAIFFYHYDGVNGARDFLFRRFYDPKWALVYVDRYAVIFVKNNEQNAELIKKFQITPDNMAERLKPLTSSSNLQDQLAGADFFNLVGRVDLSMPVYMKIVSRWPQSGKIWLVLGRTELTKSDQKNSNPALAAIFLERAIAEGWKTWESYSFLALAYYRTGQIDRTEQMVKKELQLDPDNVDAQSWVGILAKDKMKNNGSK